MNVSPLTLCMDIDKLVIFTGKWGYHRQGSCQAGLGAAIAEVSYLTKAHIPKYCPKDPEEAFVRLLRNLDV